MKWTRYAAILHGTAGTLMLLAWYAFGDSGQVTASVSRLVDALVPRAGLLEAIRRCPSPSVWSLALTAVVFSTGHLLLLASLFRSWCGSWWSYLQDGERSPHFGLRLVDWLFWLPAMFVVGCSAYWVTYIEMGTGRHVICAGTPFNVWLFRMGSTSVIPFFSTFVIAIPTALVVRIHFLVTRVTRNSRS